MTMNGTFYVDSMTGGAGDQSMYGFQANDTLDGGVGDDLINGGEGNDLLTGGSGFDIVDYSDSQAAVTVFLWENKARDDGFGGIDQIYGFEAIQGSAFNDTLAGDTYNNTLYGNGGMDTFIATDGNDTYYGGDGSGDWVDYADVAGSVTMDFSTGTVSHGQYQDTLVGIESIRGTNLDDVIYGGGTIFSVDGADGNDVFHSGVANDIFYGNAGDDTFIAGAGDDRFDGGIGGMDTLDYTGNTTGMIIDMRTGYATGSGADNFIGMERIIGGAAADTIIGDDMGNIIEGGDGSDGLSGYAGMDELNGGDGDDTLDGGAGDDILIGGAGRNFIGGGDGFDLVSYSDASSSVTVNMLAQGDYQNIAAGRVDFLTGVEGVIGSSFNDRLIAGGTDTVIYGGAGDDVILSGNGMDDFDGGDGNDLVSYSLSQGSVVADLSLGRTFGDNPDVLINIEGLEGSLYADTLTGDAAGNTLYGLDGNDVLEGGAGDDFINGGYGFDRVSYANASGSVTVDLTNRVATGADGNDILRYVEAVDGGDYADMLIGEAGRNVLMGGAGNDVLDGRGGDDLLIGSYGFDTASYATSGSAVTVNLSTGTASGGGGNDTLRYIEAIVGSDYNDTLIGQAGRNVLDGGAGNDVLNGGAGDDLLIGGYGFDTASYVDASGAVTVDLMAGRSSGSDGADALRYIEAVEGGSFNDVLIGNGGRNTLLGGAGNDTLDGGAGDDYLNGGYGFDTVTYGKATGSVSINVTTGDVTGAAGHDTIRYIERVVGSNFADTIVGNSVSNQIYGGGGNDTIEAGDGNDLVVGGGGYDTLTGGAGRDLFRYAGVNEIGVAARETIMDFVRGEDRIDLAAIDAKAGVAGNNAFTMMDAGSVNAGNAEGALWFTGGALYGSIDGDVDAEFAIRLVGITSLDQTDIVL